MMAYDPEPDCGVACTPKQKPAIEMVIDNAMRAMEALEGGVSDLVARLDPVTNQIPSVDGSSEQAEPAGSSKVFHAFDQLDTRIRSTTTRVQYLIQSLEV